MKLNKPIRSWKHRQGCKEKATRWLSSMAFEPTMTIRDFTTALVQHSSIFWLPVEHEEVWDTIADYYYHNTEEFYDLVVEAEICEELPLHVHLEVLSHCLQGIEDGTIERKTDILQLEHIAGGAITTFISREEYYEQF